MLYCDYCKQPEAKLVHQQYHSQTYGFRTVDDNELFGRLILEINQAVLSWETILNKEQNFRDAYSNFDIDKVSNYGDKERQRLILDAGS